MKMRFIVLLVAGSTMAALALTASPATAATPAAEGASSTIRRCSPPREVVRHREDRGLLLRSRLVHAKAGHLLPAGTLAVHLGRT